MNHTRHTRLDFRGRSSPPGSTPTPRSRVNGRSTAGVRAAHMEPGGALATPLHPTRRCSVDGDVVKRWLMKPSEPTAKPTAGSCGRWRSALRWAARTGPTTPSAAADAWTTRRPGRRLSPVVGVGCPVDRRGDPHRRQGGRPRREVKVDRCVIAHVGDRVSAPAFLAEQGVVGPIVAATATAGYQGTATAGYRGTATAGYQGTATAGDQGTATAGDQGTATAGDEGTPPLATGAQPPLATGAQPPLATRAPPPLATRAPPPLATRVASPSSTGTAPTTGGGALKSTAPQSGRESPTASTLTATSSKPRWRRERPFDLDTIASTAGRTTAALPACVMEAVA